MPSRNIFPGRSGVRQGDRHSCAQFSRTMHPKQGKHTFSLEHRPNLAKALPPHVNARDVLQKANRTKQAQLIESFSDAPSSAMTRKRCCAAIARAPCAEAGTRVPVCRGLGCSSRALRMDAKEVLHRLMEHRGRCGGKAHQIASSEAVKDRSKMSATPMRTCLSPRINRYMVRLIITRTRRTRMARP